MFYNENGKKQVGMFYNENGKKSRWECLTMKMERKQVEMFYNENGKKKQVGMFTMKMDFSSRTGSVAWASLTSP